MHERAALEAGENGGVDFFRPVGFAHGHAGARAAQGFVRGGGDEVGDGDGGGMMAGGDEARDVRDVGHQQCADFLGDLREFFPFPRARIGAGAGDDQLGFVLEGGLADFGHVDAFGGGVEGVMDWL